MKTRFNLLRIIVALALAALLSSCSLVKLGYNNLPDVAYWWLDGYFDFNGAQSPRVRDELARLQRWHRSTELPRVADMLQRMEQLAPGEVTPAQACAFVDEVRERLLQLSEQAEGAVVSLALSLTPEQLRHLRHKYAQNNADFRKDWVDLSPTEQRDKRYKRLLERSEMVYGSLDEPQRAVLRQQTEQSVFDARLVLQELQRRQADALQVLGKVAGQGVSAEQARLLLRGYLERVQQSPNAEYRRLQDALIQEGCRSAAATHNATTAAQRESAVRRLRAYQRDLRELAADR